MSQKKTAIVGGTPERNAAVTRAILAGEESPARDIALLNAGAAIYCAGRAADIRTGIHAAAEAVDDGRAREALNTTSS